MYKSSNSTNFPKCSNNDAAEIKCNSKIKYLETGISNRATHVSI